MFENTVNGGGRILLGVRDAQRNVANFGDWGLKEKRRRFNL